MMGEKCLEIYMMQSMRISDVYGRYENLPWLGNASKTKELALSQWSPFIEIQLKQFWTFNSVLYFTALHRFANLFSVKVLDYFEKKLGWWLLISWQYKIDMSSETTRNQKYKLTATMQDKIYKICIGLFMTGIIYRISVTILFMVFVHKIWFISSLCHMQAMQNW